MTGSLFTTGAAQVLRPREASLGSKLPYLGHVDPMTVRARDGALIQVLRLRGFPAETQSDDELNYRKTVRETVLRGAAGSRLAIYHHVIRRRVYPELDGRFANSFSADLDNAWRASLAERRLYVNDLYLCLVRRPLHGQVGMVELLLKPPRDRGALERDLRQLHAVRETFIAALSPYGVETLGLTTDAGRTFSEPSAFLAALVNGEQRPVLLPGGDLGEALGQR